MMSSQTKEAESGIIKFPGTPKEVVKQCVEFIYSGEVKFSVDHISEFVELSDILGLHSLTDMYIEFLSENITADNVINIAMVAKLYKNDMIEEAIKDFFFFVRPCGFLKSQNYRNLEFSCFSYILSLMNEIVLADSVLKLSAIVFWIRTDIAARKCHFVDLFRMIDAKLLTREVVEKCLMNQSYVSDSQECLAAISKYFFCRKSAMKENTSDVACCSSSLQTQESGNVEGSRPKKRRLDSSESGITSAGVLNHILACNLESKVIYRGDLKTDVWSKVTSVPAAAGDILQYRRFIYFGNGKMLAKFDGEKWTEVWKRRKDNFDTTGCYTRLVQVREMIYMVTGTYIVTHNVNSEAAGTCIPFTNDSRDGFFVANSYSAIFIMVRGYEHNVEISHSVYVWSISSMRQQRLSPMKHPRVYGVGVFYRGTVFAIGGGQKCVEFLNTMTDQWQVIKPERLEIECTRCKAYISDKLYIFGGERLQTNVIAIDLEKLEVPEKEMMPTRENVQFKVFCRSSY